MRYSFKTNSLKKAKERARLITGQTQRIFSLIRQAAIPLAQMNAGRFTNIYDLTDSAYDAPQIHRFSESPGHKAIIDNNPCRGQRIYRDPATDKRFGQRSSVERVNSYLKDNHGGRIVRVKGSAKVMTHLNQTITRHGF